MRTALLIALALALLAVPAAAQAALPPGPYRTDAQAERFLERTRGGSAFCINGFYSKREKRTGRHFPQRSDERFRSFTCTVSGRDSSVYLQTRPHGRWVVLTDR